MKSATQSPVKIEDLFALRILQGAGLSPDRSQLVYSVSQVNPMDEIEQAALWLRPLPGGPDFQLTGGSGYDTRPAWSPDGQQIAYLSSVDGKSQLCVIRPGKPSTNRRELYNPGEPLLLTASSGGVGGGPSWSPDGGWIAFTAPSEPRGQAPNAHLRTRRTQYRFDRVGNLPSASQEIWVVPSAGGNPVMLTDDQAINTLLGWSPEGRRLLYISAFGGDGFSIDSSLMIVDLEGHARTLYSDWGRVRGGAWLRDGKRVLWVGSPGSDPLGSESGLWMGSVHEIPPRCLSLELGRGVGGLVTYDLPVSWEREPVTVLVSPDGRYAYVTVQEGGRLPVYRIALDDPPSWERLVDTPRTCILENLANGCLLLTVSTIFSPGELCMLNLQHGEETALTDLNGGWRSKRLLPTLRKHRSESGDGVVVDGWALLPPTGNPPYPTILNIHGGPHEAYGDRFVFDFHLLAGAGYAVLFSNPRGSTGYGDRFSTQIHENWGGPDYEDLMATVDHAVALGIADPERLGVYGLSYGGYMTCWIVGHTNRFKAAIAENPLTDWTSFYGTSDIGPAFAEAQLGGRPQDMPEIYRRHSPIAYAHFSETPTLLLVSEEDKRCPPGQAEQFYTALQVAGCPVEMIRFPGGAHTASWDGPPPIRRLQNEALLDWMNTYLRG